MNHLEEKVGWLNAKHQFISLMHEKDKLIVFEKGDLLFIFNFHPSKSFETYRIGTKWASEHIILLDTDESRFGGKDMLKYGHKNYFPFIKEKWLNRPNYIQLYIPSRTAMVLIAKENIPNYDLKDYLTELS
jgi:1,4-alpha-glucan branching enzyme